MKNKIESIILIACIIMILGLILMILGMSFFGGILILIEIPIIYISLRRLGII